VTVLVNYFGIGTCRLMNGIGHLALSKCQLSVAKELAQLAARPFVKVAIAQKSDILNKIGVFI